jgi:hypothetical protein
MVLWAGACADGQTRTDGTSVDRREPVTVSLEVRDAIRREMRTMLSSLNTLLTAGARGDTSAMREAAARSGLAAAADPALAKILPAEFLKLGMSTHRQFDELGGALQAGMTSDSVLARLGRLTASCVACHAAFRLTTP